MLHLDQSQIKKAGGTRWLEIESVNPWCDRPRFFHFKIGWRHLLHTSRKSRMLPEMISIWLPHSIYDWIHALPLTKNNFDMWLNKIFVIFYKILHHRRCAMICQNGVGCDTMWLVYMGLIQPVSYMLTHNPHTHLWHICHKKLTHCSKWLAECYALSVIRTSGHLKHGNTKEIHFQNWQVAMIAIGKYNT